MPQLRAAAWPHVADLGAVLAVCGFSTAWAAWHTRAAAPVPVGDPDLAASLRYRET
jgi:hypothetical protein